MYLECILSTLEHALYFEFAKLQSAYTTTASLSILKYIEYDRTENKIRENIIKDNIIMKDGYISVNDKPGLGVDVDETYLNEIKI